MFTQTIVPIAAKASTSTVAPQRLASLDVFRGVTVAVMILVTDPGTYDAVYSPLRHALWTGATPTDMIFPAFLFIVGVAVPLALESRLRRGIEPGPLARRVLRRSVLLLLVGVLLNAVPDFTWHTLRLPGILQRIAVCYLCASLLYLALRPRSLDTPTRLIPSLSAIAIAIWATYWLALKLIPVPGIGAGHLDPYGNLPAYLDRALFGIHHLWAYGLAPGRGVTYDPEGLLSTAPALASTLVGVLAGTLLSSPTSVTRKTLTLAGAGLTLVLLSALLSPWMPVNKRIWTPTFALLSSGVCLCLFALCYRLLDSGPAAAGQVRPSPRRDWTLPATIFGTNALLAFALSGLLTTALDRIHVGSGGPDAPTLHTWGYHLFTAWLSPVNASLAYAVLIVLLNLAFLYPFYRERLFFSL